VIGRNPNFCCALEVRLSKQTRKYLKFLIFDRLRDDVTSLRQEQKQILTFIDANRHQALERVGIKKNVLHHHQEHLKVRKSPENVVGTEKSSRDSMEPC